MNSLHPAQALPNMFREPQYNYLEVQDFLNFPQEERAVLLSDLAKAFERVNPHWLIHVLICRGVSYWVLNYCRHILFGRRVLHKIHSTFRPPLAIHNGVDMGRAFSFLLFCIAMDPWYYHVHQIPRVLINRGYMDDNATGGSGLEWLFAAQILFQKFSEAGFVVLSHHCYTAECILEPSYQTPCFSLASPSPMVFPPSGLPSHPCFGPLTCAYARAHAVSYFTPHFFLIPPISHAVNILTFSHSSILHRVNTSVKPFSSLTFLFLPLTSPYSILPLGGVRLSLRPPQC